MRSCCGWAAAFFCGVVILSSFGCRRQEATATENLNKPVGLPPCCAGKASDHSSDSAQGGNTHSQGEPDDAQAAGQRGSGDDSAAVSSARGPLKQAECCEGANCPATGSGACCEHPATDVAVAAGPGKADDAPVENAKPVDAEPAKGNGDGTPAGEKKPDDAARKTTKLFDGKTLKGWKKTAFGGEGEVKVEDGMIVMEIGNDMTGVTYDGQLPATDNFELTLRAQRLDGDDFFCATTFPIGKEHCTLVLGGWGGTLVGISCVDGYDASDNTTTRSMTFKNKQWYDVRIRVSTKKLEAWIDGEQVVNLPRGDHKFSTRFECDPCRPLGFATWRTKGAVKGVEFRELSKDEVAEISEDE